MNYSLAFKRVVIGMGTILTLSACKTVSMPKLDFIKTPEFNEDAANIDKSFPSVQEAPDAPTDVRSAQQWDRDVRALQALRNKRRPVDIGQHSSELDADARFEELKAKVQAYKKDDPVTGPVQGFPDYKPRR